jgi:hypothetical protein
MSNLTDSGLQQFARQINEAVSALIELEAMKAENQQREAEGCSPAYTYDQIMNLQNQYALDYNSIVDKYREFQ